MTPLRFEFATAQRIVFGAGAAAQLPALVRELGSRPLIVTGRTPARAQRLLDALADAGMPTTTVSIRGEPTTEQIAQALSRARAAACDCVVGYGGGSAIDAAKAIAALLNNPGDLFDYLEVVGRARPLARPSVPWIAVPTTAGTGSEATKNAVLTVTADRLKVSLRSPHMLPRVAVVDPELTYDLPAAVTAATGLDALTQLIEPYVSTRANPVTDAFCVEGIRRAARSLRRAVADGHDADARADLALASLFSGMALANAGLGAVHGFASPIGGAFPAPHGAVCAALLPHVLRANLTALRRSSDATDRVRRFTDVARLLTDSPHATADDAVNWTNDVVTELRLPRLNAYGITASDLPHLVAAAAQASSMKANPVVLTAEELMAVLRAAL